MDAGTPCVTCNTLPSPWALAVIYVVVVGCVLWLAIDAAIEKRGSRWFATMAGGIIFGEIVEWMNTHYVPFLDTHQGCPHSYCYPDLGPWLDWFGVPFWIPVGWGGIIYAATWTAGRLQIPWWARSIVSSFLVVTIDFSLDPIANLMNFWTWQYPAVSFIGVPYDNFIGWYLIVLIYSLSSAFVLRRYDEHWNFAAGSKLTAAETRKSILVQCAAAIGSALVATVALIAVEALLTHLAYSSGASDGHTAAIIFMVAVAVGALVTLFVVRGTGDPPDPDQTMNWPALLVPVVIHLACYGLYLGFGEWREPMLIAAIPIQLLAGVFVFAQPWLRQLPTANVATGVSPKP
jgi:uncharacterized membrane protein